MTPDINIHRPDGTVRMAAIIGVGSKRNFMLMEKDSATLKFTAAEPTHLRLGDYIDLEGAGRYELTDPYKPERDKSTGGYDYEIELKAQYWKFANKLMKFLPFTGSGETSWEYTGAFAEHAAQIMRNIEALAYDRRADGTTELKDGGDTFLYRGRDNWDYFADASVDTAKVQTLTYDSTNIIDGITALAEAYDCEWWFEESILHFGKCQYGDTPVELAYGDEIASISRKDSKETYATRIFAYGGNRNIPANYRKELIFTADTVQGREVSDSIRPLEASHFPAAIRTSNPSDSRVLSVGGGDESVRQSGSTAIEAKFADLANHTDVAIPAGFWDFDMNTGHTNIRVSDRSGVCSELKAILTLTFQYADHTTKTEAFTNNCYIPASPYDATIGGFGTKRIQLEQEVTRLTANLQLFACLGAGSSIRLNWSASRSVNFSNAYGIKGAAGLTLNIIDTATGEVKRAIEGVTFNPGFVAKGGTLQLPSGASMAQGEKYTIANINKAFVPDSYFTSKYAVLTKYADLVTNGIVNSRLLLPEYDADGKPIHGYIDAREMQSEEEAVEDVVIFEDIYPSRESRVEEVVPIEGFTDEDEEGKTYTAYAIKDDLFNAANPFNKDYLIDGADLQITFQTGALAGLTFDVLYTDDHLFEIQRDQSNKLPSETIKPAVGDTYILSGFDVAMLNDEHTDYISGAERRLLEKAREYVEELNTDTQTYDCTLACDFAEQRAKNSPGGLCFEIGRTVKLIHPAYFADGRISRVIGYEIPLDIPYDNPVYYIGEKAKYSRLGAIEDKLDSIETNPGTLGGAGSTTQSGAGVYVIAQDDATAPTDKNVYSALRSRAEFALKTATQTIAHLWKFLRGIRIGNYTEGLSGAAIDEMGHAEVESLNVRSYMKVFELIYNRLNALEGNTSFADTGTIDLAQAGAGEQQVLTMRKRWDGDFTSFQPGDIIYGYINNLGNTGESERIKAWAWVQSVDRAANTLTVVPYPDTEVPGGKNHPLTPNMVVTRWGNNIAATEKTWGKYGETVITKRGENDYKNNRQSSFYISCEDGNIVELMGVDKPIITAANYGTILGRIPDGLFDSATQELINRDHPYLFARGIVVQDLIRVDYEGVTARTANYRGRWSAETAAVESTRYRSTSSTYDTVTHNGSLWQCIADGTTDEPSEQTGSWLCMTGDQDLSVWQIFPSADIVTIRYTEGADGQMHAEISPASVSCEAVKHSTGGARTFANNYDLEKEGVQLWYSLNGDTWEEFIIGSAEPLELEDGSGYIEAETSTEENPEALTIGGDDVLATRINDRIYFELRSIPAEGETEGEVKARATIPVVKDGLKGDDGDNGLMVYPSGYFDEAVTYTATGTTAPVVMYGEDFYVLKRGCTYQGTAMPTDRNTPAKDVANGGDDARWQHMERFNAIFADIVMANFAKLSSAVFSGDYMFSQQGTLFTKTEHRYKTAPAGTNLILPASFASSRTPTSWSDTYPESVMEGRAVFMITASINKDDTLRGEWSQPVEVTEAVPNTLTETQDSSEYQHITSESFTPNFSVNFLTGEATAKGFTFREFIRPSETTITSENYPLYTTNHFLPIDVSQKILDAPKFTDKVIIDASMSDIFSSGEVWPYLILPSRRTAGENPHLDDYVGKVLRIINNSATELGFTGLACMQDSPLGNWNSSTVQPGEEVVFRCVFYYNEDTDVKEIGWKVEYLGKQ